MRNKYSRARNQILLVLLGFSTVNTVIAGEKAKTLLSIYEKSERQVANCQDIKCYRSVMNKFGSATAVAKLKLLSAEDLNKLFDTIHGTAKDFVTNRHLFKLVDETIDSESAKLVLERSLTDYPKGKGTMTKTLYFQKEDGKWKVGK